jgi:hypothetical protein
MNCILERIWKEVVVTYSRYYPSICLEGLREITRNAPVRTAYVPAENCTKHLPNPSLDSYRYANSLGSIEWYDEYKMISNEAVVA